MGARSRSRNARRQWNRMNNRCGLGARGLGFRRGRGVGGGRGESVAPEGDVVDQAVPIVGVVDVDKGGDYVNLEKEADDHIDEDVRFEVTPIDGSGQIVVEVFQGELDDEGFDEVPSK